MIIRLCIEGFETEFQTASRYRLSALALSMFYNVISFILIFIIEIKFDHTFNITIFHQRLMLIIYFIVRRYTMDIVPNGQSSLTLVNRPGPTPGISARAFAASAAAYAAQGALNRYGPKLADAVVNRVDKTVDNLTNYISGKGADGSDKGKDVKSTSSTKSGKGNGKHVNGNSNSNFPSNGNNGNSGGSGNNNPRRHKKGGNGNSTPSVSSLGGGGLIAPTKGVPQVPFNSGIPSGTFRNDHQRTTEAYSPLYILCGNFIPDVKLGTNKDSIYYDLMNTDLFSIYRNMLGRKLNAFYDQGFNKESFLDYMFIIAQMLQLYYTIDSVCAYSQSGSGNTNAGMVHLNLGIDSRILVQHTRLKGFLEMNPIPPNLLTYIRHMYQNYSFSSIRGSSIIRLSYKAILNTAEGKDGAIDLPDREYNTLINKIQDLNKISAMIKEIRPDWVQKMPPSSQEALYDPQFTTFWHNSCVCWEDYDDAKTVRYSQTTENESENLYYGVFGHELDGLIYASCSINLNGCVETGLWVPFIDFSSKDAINSSLLYFDKENKITSIYSIEYRVASMIYAAPFIGPMNDQKRKNVGDYFWQLLKFHYSPSYIIQVHNINNINQAILSSINYLFDPR